MNEKPRGGPARPPRRGALSSLDALDLALESQKMELETDAFLLKLLPLLDAVEKLCRGLDREPPETIVAKAEALAILADMAEAAAAQIGLERSGRIGEPVDRDRHEVVDTVLSSDQPHGTVLEIIHGGWLLEGRVLRRAGVVASMEAPHGEKPEQHNNPEPEGE